MAYLVSENIERIEKFFMSLSEFALYNQTVMIHIAT